MRNFFINIGIIILVHIIWCFTVVLISLHTDMGNDVVSAMSFFLTEPVFMFVVYPIIVSIIDFLCFKHIPCNNPVGRRILIIISLVCTFVVVGRYFFDYYLPYCRENGFELFIYKDRWQDILFK